MQIHLMQSPGQEPLPNFYITMNENYKLMVIKVTFVVVVCFCALINFKYVSYVSELDYKLLENGGKTYMGKRVFGDSGKLMGKIREIGSYFWK